MNAKLSALKNKITGKVGSLLASPKTTYFGIKKATADSDADTIKTAREYKGAPKFEVGKGPTDAFKYQSASDAIKAKLKK